MEYRSITQLLEFIDEPNKSSCKRLWVDYQERFRISPGSLTKHQAWVGGYVGHLEETMNFGISLFHMMDGYRKLDFNISDIVLILFIHDLEKPFRYVDPKIEFHSDVEKKDFIEGKIKEYGIELSENHMNALRYIHGEDEHYSRTERVQKPLAAFVHVCDTVSARIWFDYPNNK